MHTAASTTPRANDAGLTEALLIAAPPLAAAVIVAITLNTALSDSPALWIWLIAGLAVAATTLAAAVEAARHPLDPRSGAVDSAGLLIWPLLLIWPVAFAYYMATRPMRGLPARTASGVMGALALGAALAWSAYHIHETRAAVRAELDAALHAIDSGTADAAEAERQRAVDARIERMLDAEQP